MIQRLPSLFVVLIGTVVVINSSNDAVAAAAAAEGASSKGPPPIPPPPTDYISCDDPCDGGDVNYVLTSSIQTMKLLDYTYRGRTYSTNPSETFMGPTMHVKPGQSLWIKFVNNMTNVDNDDDIASIISFP